jgi:hypothetical protein
VLLLVVVVAFWVLDSIGSCRLGPGRYLAARVQAERLAMVVEGFRDDCGRLPDQLDELFGVVRDRNCFTTPQRTSQLIDPWGRPLVYWRASDGSAFELRSVGRDRVYGSFDDLASGGWIWPWPQPPWPGDDRDLRADPLVMLALTLLLAGGLMQRLVVVATCLVRAAWRWFRPVRTGVSGTRQ